MKEYIEQFSKASDGMLATPLAGECKKFLEADRTDAETLKFLRNLRDKAVHSSGASSFVMQVLSILLDPYDEAPEEYNARIAELEASYGHG